MCIKNNDFFKENKKWSNVMLAHVSKYVGLGLILGSTEDGVEPDKQKAIDVYNFLDMVGDMINEEEATNGVEDG